MFPPQEGNVNNKLHPEKFLPSCFRTGVRFPSTPPTGHYVNTYFFYGGFALKIPFKSNAITEKPPKS